MKVSFNYLKEQFSDCAEDYLNDFRPIIASGEFTFGPFVEAFEKKFADYVGVKHVIGTCNGTDALILALKGAGIQPGDEVITVPNTFYATVGAIVACGARPVFVDCDDRYQIDVTKIESVLTQKTKAIVPVHWGGASPDMIAIMALAEKRGLKVVEDACPSVGARIGSKFAGTFGHVNGFSMHPLKPLNVMGDGGMVATNDDQVAQYLRTYQNHGMTDRDHISMWGINSRLQPIQAVVASRVLDQIEDSLAIRNRNTRQLDEGLNGLEDFIRHPLRLAGSREACQLYLVTAKKRDGLVSYLTKNGIEVKVHYPVPLHLQPAAAGLGYKLGDFPMAETQAREIMTIPSHQYVTPDQIDFILEKIRGFYKV